MGDGGGTEPRDRGWADRHPQFAAVIATVGSELLVVAIVASAAPAWAWLNEVAKSVAFWFVAGAVPAATVGVVLSVRTARRAQQQVREVTAASEQRVETAVEEALARDARDRVHIGANLAQIAPPVAPERKVRLCVQVLLLGGRPFVGPKAKIQTFDVFFNIGQSILGGHIPLHKRYTHHSVTENDVCIDAECFLDDETAAKILNYCLVDRFPYLVIANARVVIGDLDVEKVRAEVPLGLYGGRSDFPMASSEKTPKSKAEEYERSVASQFLYSGYLWGKMTKEMLVGWSKTSGNTYLVGPFDPAPVLPLDLSWFLQAGEVRVALERLDALLKEVAGPPAPPGFTRLLHRDRYGTAAENAFADLERACRVASEAHGLTNPIELVSKEPDAPRS